jgi:hypothetical protein
MKRKYSGFTLRDAMELVPAENLTPWALDVPLGCTLPRRHTSVKKAGCEQFLEFAGRSVAKR